MTPSIGNRSTGTVSLLFIIAIALLSDVHSLRYVTPDSRKSIVPISFIHASPSPLSSSSSSSSLWTWRRLERRARWKIERNDDYNDNQVSREAWSRLFAENSKMVDSDMTENSTNDNRFIISSSDSTLSNHYHNHNHINSNNRKRNICVLVSADDEEYWKVAQEVADTLSLEVIHEEELRDSRDGDGADHDHDQDTRFQLFHHCLRIVPYQYNSLLSSYAVAIQPFPNHHRNTKQQNKQKKKRNTKRVANQAPFYVDFFPPSNSKLGRRVHTHTHTNPQHGTRSNGSELVLKAVAPSKLNSRNDNDDDNGGAIVYDLTAGFGQDSLILATGGASVVHMVERDLVVAALLQDALRRLHLLSSLDESGDNDDDTDRVRQARDLSQKLKLHTGHAVEFAKSVLSQSQSKHEQDLPRPDVCYLDPMFPPRTKSAAVKKHMQILHSLLSPLEDSNHNKNDDDGHNDDEKYQQQQQQQHQIDSEKQRNRQERELLQAALSIAKVKVVVKRPIHALPLGHGIINDDDDDDDCDKDNDNGHDIKPSYQIKGSVNRWDVYVV